MGKNVEILGASKQCWEDRRDFDTTTLDSASFTDMRGRDASVSGIGTCSSRAVHGVVSSGSRL